MELLQHLECRRERRGRKTDREEGSRGEAKPKKIKLFKERDPVKSVQRLNSVRTWLGKEFAPNWTTVAMMELQVDCGELGK
jgi:hypothetical protein